MFHIPQCSTQDKWVFSFHQFGASYFVGVSKSACCVVDNVYNKCHHYHHLVRIKSGLSVNILRQRQNGRHLADAIFKYISLMENVRISIKACSEGSNWQNASMGSDNALAPNRWQAIIWTNDDLCCWRIYVYRPEWVNRKTIQGEKLHAIKHTHIHRHNLRFYCNHQPKLPQLFILIKEVVVIFHSLTTIIANIDHDAVRAVTTQI